jgi:nanoRNase/pAp phosphatase (c-di-AMP/oligoRNAs hydrolase)
MMTAETGTYRWMAPEVSSTAVIYFSFFKAFRICAN